MPYKDPEKAKAYREAHKAHKAAYNKKYNKTYYAVHGAIKAKHNRSRREWVQSLKTVPCSDCGNTYHPCAMDFDHVRGSKTGNVSHLASLKKERVLIEIAKCDVVCSNCHRLRTYRRRHKSDALVYRGVGIRTSSEPEGLF